MSLDLTPCYKLEDKDIWVDIDDIWELTKGKDTHLNITHNLGTMASEVKLYDTLWRPYKLLTDFTDEDMRQYEYMPLAEDLIPFVEIGLKKLKADPDKYKKFNPSNGWGTYEGLVRFTEKYLQILKDFPDSHIRVSR